MSEIVVASFNVHGGIDGWGRPFDVEAACRELDADVLVLQEMWAPIGVALGSDVADKLGYEAHGYDMAPAWLWPPASSDPPGWGPHRWRRRRVGLRLDERSAAGTLGPDSIRHGTVGLVLLNRLPAVRVEHVDLGRFPGDLTRRGVVIAEFDVGGSSLLVVGTHMPHLRHGSLVLLRRLQRALATSSTRMVLLGDMNLWGPPLRVLLPNWRRAVRGRTWPAWRPLAQLDHVLLGTGVSAASASILRVGNSDHRAVRVTVRPT